MRVTSTRHCRLPRKYRSAHSLAPGVVLEQHLTVPGAPSSLLDALADSAPLLPLSVLRVRLPSRAPYGMSAKGVDMTIVAGLRERSMHFNAPQQRHGARRPFRTRLGDAPERR